MDKTETEKLLDGMELISGYISNELNSGKSKEYVINSLINKMNISKEVATNLVYKNDGLMDKMKYFGTSYIRKNLLIYVLSSFAIYSLIFSAFFFINNQETIILFSKYLGMVFGIIVILYGFSMNESKNIYYKYFPLTLTTILSLSSFLLGSLFLNYISWDNTDIIKSDTTLKFKILISIVNLFIELGPQIVGGIFLLISLLFVGISWQFYYKITIDKLNK